MASGIFAGVFKCKLPHDDFRRAHDHFRWRYYDDIVVTFVMFVTSIFTVPALIRNQAPGRGEEGEKAAK